MFSFRPVVNSTLFILLSTSVANAVTGDFRPFEVDIGRAKPLFIVCEAVNFKDQGRVSRIEFEGLRESLRILPDQDVDFASGALDILLSSKQAWRPARDLRMDVLVKIGDALRGSIERGDGKDLSKNTEIARKLSRLLATVPVNSSAEKLIAMIKHATGLWTGADARFIASEIMAKRTERYGKIILKLAGELRTFDRAEIVQALLDVRPVSLYDRSLLFALNVSNQNLDTSLLRLSAKAYFSEEGIPHEITAWALYELHHRFMAGDPDTADAIEIFTLAPNIPGTRGRVTLTEGEEFAKILKETGFAAPTPEAQILNFAPRTNRTKPCEHHLQHQSQN